ncbi:5-oxoprolinase subunit PxpB [Carboxylicivirga caseinilyticus]|uniref:5-oxoprolinase subunit PxpB n=1 Tax=Carboxylicivirga caseinilyticus TaxID=3417572 RepID=UPI003D32E4ED|nr:5-oxoprolinase subunit PxpB [Marinilabiliaceae bacterium A049]
MEFNYHILGDSAVLIRLEQEISPRILEKANAFTNAIQSLEIKGITQVLPSYSEVTIFYNPTLISLPRLLKTIKKIKIEDFSYNKKEVRLIHIPVCYDISLGLDIESVAEHHQIKIETLIDKHCSNKYLVYMLGFTPGFAYLGGLNPQLATPRKQTPRKLIPAGSVGIAGNQTGIYPINSPGGWQILGQTPIKMFDINRKPEVFIQSGDYIQFDPITIEEFNKIKESTPPEYQIRTEKYTPEYE